MLSCSYHRGGWESNDILNTCRGNRRKNASPTALTFHQWKAMGSGLSLLPHWVSGNQNTFSTPMMVRCGINSYFIVFNDCHSSFLWNHLDRTNPVIMWYGINNPGMKKFGDFLLHDFSHRIVEPTLRLPWWCTIWVNWNAMGTKCWAYSLEILQGIPKDWPMLF